MADRPPPSDLSQSNSPFDTFGQPDHERWIREALQEACRAEAKGEVPIGCVVVYESVIIARGHNQTESLQDPTAHAEMIAITAAAEALGSRRLLDCTLYATLEPCTMCCGAMVLARIPLVVFGAADPKAGAVDTFYNLLSDPRLNHTCEVVRGVLSNECGAILSDFFLSLRKQKKNGV